MLLPNKPHMQLKNPQSKIHRSLRLALLVTIGLIIFVFENYLPRPLPWAKPGLANIASVLALYWFGIPSALIVTVLRILLGAMIVGSLFNPAFLLSLGGGLFAVFAMGVTRYLGKQYFSMIGISVIGAFFHIFTQFVLAYFLLINQIVIFYFLPAMLISSVITGLGVGILSFLLDKKLTDSGIIE